MGSMRRTAMATLAAAALTAASAVAVVVPTGAPAVAGGPAGAPGRIIRVSVSNAGTQADGESYSPRFSGDGRILAFHSNAANLPEPWSDEQGLLVRDLRRGTLSRFPGVAGYGAALSTDGRYIAYSTGWNMEIRVLDRLTGTDTVESPPPGAFLDEFFDPTISGDGRFVAYASTATNIVAGDTNQALDVFLRDRRTGTTTRASVTGTGAEANGGSYQPSITPDGRFLAFRSGASNLVPGDTNNVEDIFVRDLKTGAVTRVSVSNTGAELVTDGTWPGAMHPSISANGRYVVFESIAGNLFPGDAGNDVDIFVRDLWAGTTRHVTVSTTGAQADGDCWGTSISADGRYVVFSSGAANLVPGDTNGLADIFRRDLWTGRTTLINVARAGTQPDGDSLDPVVSADGSIIAFTSLASNLVPDDTNEASDVFVRNMAR